MRKALCLLALLAGACATAEPATSHLRPASAIAGKISAPVDVHYQLTAAALPNQPLVVSLVLTPRVAGTRMTADLVGNPAIQLAKQTLIFSSNKTTVGSAVRRSFVITPGVTPADDIMVLVSIDVNGARYASYFRLPLSEQPSADQAAISGGRDKRGGSAPK
ncbi:MAG: hypothetical protein KDI32_08740 [Pseudomonadales bacterium]|nr:hypothetical protein [Pseudomonadales bacterium]